MDDRAELVRHWTRKIECIEGTKLTKHPGDRDSRSRTLVRFTIPDPATGFSYSRANELRLEHDEQHFLLLSQYRTRNTEHSRKVSDLLQIESFVRDVQRRYSKRHAAKQHRTKLNQFKTKAIIAQVQSMAKEEGFDYASVSDNQKVKLYVRLRGPQVLEIQIPFSRFEQTLPQVKHTIRTMMNLYHEGLRFKVTPDSSIPWNIEWINHETP